MGSAYSSDPPQHLRTSLRHPPGGALLLPQNDTPAATGYRECFFLEAAHARRLLARSAAMTPTTVIRASTATAPRPRPSSQPASWLEANFFTNGVTADLIKRIDAGRPVATGWLHKRPQLQPSGQRPRTVVTATKRAAGFTNDRQRLRPISSGWVHQQLKRQGPALQRQERGIPAGARRQRRLVSWFVRAERTMADLSKPCSTGCPSSAPAPSPGPAWCHCSH